MVLEKNARMFKECSPGRNPLSGELLVFIKKTRGTTENLSALDGQGRIYHGTYVFGICSSNDFSVKGS